MSDDPAVVVLWVEGAAACEKFRNALGGARGAVLLRLRTWEETLGT